MQRFNFVDGTNVKTGLPQLKMEVRNGKLLTVFIVDNKSALVPSAGDVCLGEPMWTLVETPTFELVTVNVTEIIEKASDVAARMQKHKMLNPAFADDFKASKQKSEVPNVQKRAKAKVVFQKTEQGTAAIAHLDGANVLITPATSGVQPKAEERWEVEFGRVRLVDASEQYYTAECNLVRRLPDLGPQTSKASGISAEPYVVGTIPEGVEPDLDLVMVRGINTTSGEDQWQARTQDALGNQVLYVCDRESPMLPSMNGQKFGVLVGKQIFPKDDAPDAETAAFKIKLVSIIRYYEPELPKPVFSTPVSSPTRSKGRAEREHRREARRAELQARATKKGPGKGGKQSGGRQMAHA